MDIRVVDKPAVVVEEERSELGFPDVKVCVILALNSVFGVFLVDLSLARLDYGVDADKFSEIKPNFRISYETPARPLLFYVLRGSLYIFTLDRLGQNRNGLALDLQVYTINLSDLPEEISNTRFEVAKLEQCAGCLGPKASPRAVGYGGNILLFSTRFNFSFIDLISTGDDDRLLDASLLDFEIYDPRGCESRRLPQLHVCRPTSCYDCSSVLRLFNSAKSEYSEEFYDHRSGKGFSMGFSIVSFCVDEDNLIIKTDLGSMFSLKLDGDGDDGWRLCEECYVFESINRNIVTPNGLCFDAFGANDYRRRWSRDGTRPENSDYSSLSREAGRCVGFPVTPIDPGLVLPVGTSYASAVDLLEGDPRTPCIVRIAFDSASVETDIASKLYLFLDVLRLKLEEEFPADDDKDDDHKFVERMMSFKFCLSEYLFLAFVVGLFHY